MCVKGSLLVSLGFLGFIYKEITDKQATYIHIANAECEQFPFHSLHDIQFCLVVLQNDCEIKV